MSNYSSAEVCQLFVHHNKCWEFPSIVYILIHLCPLLSCSLRKRLTPIVGWFVSLVSIVWILLGAIHEMYKNKGSLVQLSKMFIIQSKKKNNNIKFAQVKDEENLRAFYVKST